jgi:hypothetical protein
MAKVEPGGPTPRRLPFRVASLSVVTAVFVGLAWRQLHFVDTHAVNILFWDQWDLYKPLFENQGWWQTFILQHGPHREGVGLVLMRILAELSGWNSRWEAFAESFLMIGAAALGLRLSLRFGVPSHALSLVAVPLLFLNVIQYEIFVGAVNLSHGAMPMLLFMAYCLCWFARNDRWRVLAISALTFLLIFTGFGVFVGGLTPLLFAVEGVQAWRAGERRHAAIAAGGLAAAGLSWALFARGYIFQAAVPGFRFPYEHPTEYGVFIGRMLGNFFGAPMMSQSGVFLGLVVAAALLAIALWHGWRVVRIGVVTEPRSAVLFCLAAFTLTYCANNAVGRVFTGPYAPLASRYVTLMIPGGMALFLQLALLGAERPFHWPALVFAALLVPGTAFPRSLDTMGINWYTEGRIHWKAAYLATHDEAQANKASHFSIYPGPLGDRLTFLEDRHLNLFAPSK